MELFEDPAFKTKYLKNKRRVKLWESDFMDKYGRKPNRNDIKEADITIKEAYKIYWKLKTRALEETLTDITFCDDAQSNVSNKSPCKSLNEQKYNKSPKKVARDTENIDPHNDKHSTEIEQCIIKQVDTTNVEGVWGDHLNKNKEEMPKKKQALVIGRSSSFQLSRNKFESSSFTKRNPRKSLSSNKLKNKSESNGTAVLSGNQEENIHDKNYSNMIEEMKSMFGEVMKVKHEENKSIAQSISAVQQLIDGYVTGVSRNLNQGWLERCTKTSNLEVSTFKSQRLSGNSDSGVESIGSGTYSPINLVCNVNSTIPLQIQDDEEDYICNSDSDEERRNKRIRNFKKHLNDQDNPPAKRLRTEIKFDRTGDSIDVDTSRLAFNVNTSFNTMNKDNKDEINFDDINTVKLISDVNSNTNLLNESISIRSRRNTDTINLNVESNVTAKNDVVTKDIYPIKIDEIKIGSRMINNILKSKDLADQDGPIPDKKEIKQHISQRRMKTSSDNSDSDYIEEKQENRKVKTKVKRGISKIRVTRRSTGLQSKKKVTNSEETASSRRSSRRYSNLESDEERNTNPGSGKMPIYSVETIQTVPRFSMKSASIGDLIADFSDSIDGKDAVLSKTVTKLTDKEKLEKKIEAGTMNNNFVRIDLKKKVFVRGKKNFNLSKYKKNHWKQRKKESSESNLDAADLIDKNGTTCFKCGEFGHFARNCTASKGDALLPLEEIDESSNFPTLEEAEKMANENAIVVHSHRIDRLPKNPSYFATKIPYSQNEEQEEEIMAELCSDDFTESDKKGMSIFRHKIPQELISRLLPPPMEMIDPLYPVNEHGSLVETPTEIFEALRIFGHGNFKAGQEKAVMRILSGWSTLVTLSTGSGKSLCYQLPAYLYSQRSHCITLVISPLVSLMDDQITGMPFFLSAACLHTSQSTTVREQVMQSVKNGKVNILLISPEAVVAGEKSTGFGALLRQLPPIAFACIDEAHCISQWSHNFRPSYLMVCRVLKEKLGVRTVLGLTATATRATAESIAKHLDLRDGMAGVISDVPVPKNLVMTVSKDSNKDQALITLLKSERFRKCDSVIIYCTRREECARIAGLLRVSLQDSQNSEKPNAKISTMAEAYHAGMTPHRRKLVQKEFMRGKIKIVVATVAFGMGINKSDIRAIIHYNMTSTFEGYVQEIGRAGRDNLMAYCHLFLNPMQDNDKWELRRHIYANGVDRHTIRHLLQRIFIPCSCANINGKDSNRRCSGHEVALPIDETVKALDITEETISTLLCYLELHPKKLITVLSSVYVRARVSSYNGPQALKRAAQSSPPLAMAIALDRQKGISHEDSNIIEFPIIDVASAIGWDSGVVKSYLKNLEWTSGVDGKMRRSALSVHYDKLGLRIKAPGDLTDTELDETLDALIARTRSQESSCLRQLEIISSALNKISVPSIKHCSVLDDDIVKRSEDLKNIIREYFQLDSSLNNIDINSQDKVANEQEIAADVRSLITCYRDTNFTGRAVARIFHGIQSPNYPAVIWGRCRFWRAHLATNFNGICKIATKEILALR